MAIEVFNRKENKYMIDDNTYRQLVERLEEYMYSDEHSKDGGFYSISNVYYDTDTDELIRRSLAKPVYKEKLRLRSYGMPKDDDKVFIEIKKKYKGVVGKRRISLPYTAAIKYLEEGIRPDEGTVNSQILREIDYFRTVHKVVPKVWISYDRRAYFGKEDPGFRVTFDTNMRARRTDVDLQASDEGEQLVSAGKWLMEVKITNSMPQWFANLLTEFKIFPASFSKYGTEYKKYVVASIKKGEKVICLTQYSAQQAILQPAH